MLDEFLNLNSSLEMLYDLKKIEGFNSTLNQQSKNKIQLKINNPRLKLNSKSTIQH